MRKERIECVGRLVCVRIMSSACRILKTAIWLISNYLEVDQIPNLICGSNKNVINNDFQD